MNFAMNADATPNYRGARKLAGKLVEDYTAPSIPAVEVAEQNGVNVIFADMGKFKDEVAGFCDFKSKRIYVNKENPRNRQMFTVAHELGHWMLHRAAFDVYPEKYPVLPRFQNPDESNAFEREANAFASELLVPEHLLKQVRGYSAAALAELFGVSRAMMEVRLKR